MQGCDANEGGGFLVVPNRRVNDPRPLEELRGASHAPNATPGDVPAASALETGRMAMPAEAVTEAKIDDDNQHHDPDHARLDEYFRTAERLGVSLYALPHFVDFMLTQLAATVATVHRRNKFRERLCAAIAAARASGGVPAILRDTVKGMRAGGNDVVHRAFVFEAKREQARSAALRAACVQREESAAAAAAADALAQSDAAATADALAQFEDVRAGRDGDDGAGTYVPLLCEPALPALLARLGAAKGAETATVDGAAAALAESCYSAACRLMDAADPIRAELLQWQKSCGANRWARQPTPLLAKLCRDLTALAPLGGSVRAAVVLSCAFNCDAAACAVRARDAELKLHFHPFPLQLVGGRAEQQSSESESDVSVESEAEVKTTVNEAAVVQLAKPQGMDKVITTLPSPRSESGNAGFLKMALITLLIAALAAIVGGVAVVARCGVTVPRIVDVDDAAPALATDAMAAPTVRPAQWSPRRTAAAAWAATARCGDQASGLVGVVAAVGLADVASRRGGGVPAAARIVAAVVMHAWPSIASHVAVETPGDEEEDETGGPHSRVVADSGLEPISNEAFCRKRTMTEKRTQNWKRK